MYFITTIDPKDNDVRCVGYFSDKDMATYQQAYDAYANAMAVLEDSEEAFSEIGTTVMSYLKKNNE